MKILLLAKILATQACRQCKAILSQWESILLCFALTEVFPDGVLMNIDHGKKIGLL